MDQMCQQISEVLGRPFDPSQQQSVGGGCINSAFVLTDQESQLFVKTNRPEYMEMFAAEFDGLNEISKTGTIRVPEPICYGEVESHAYIAMEYLAIGNGSGSGVQLGQDLARLHQVQQEQYGWCRDNTIGSTQQVNDYESVWVSFWREKRLAFQLDLAASKGYGGQLQKKGELLLGKLDSLFESYTPKASLLHGDLWSGNYAFDDKGTPVIFDPATYYGDREADIAMTELFGGFPRDFYQSYNEIFPLDVGYKTRKILYNLYHIINHLNMFGGGYLGQAQSMTEQLLSELN